MKKDQCDAHVAADVVKAAVVKGGDLQRAGKRGVCHRREFQFGQSPSPVTGDTSLSQTRTLEMLELSLTQEEPGDSRCSRCAFCRMG